MDISHHLRLQIKHLPTARTKDTSPGSTEVFVCGSPCPLKLVASRFCSRKFQFEFLILALSETHLSSEKEKKVQRVFHNFYCSYFWFLFFFLWFDSISITNNVKCTIIKYIYIYLYGLLVVPFVFFSSGLTLVVHTTRQLLKNC